MEGQVIEGCGHYETYKTSPQMRSARASWEHREVFANFGARNGCLVEKPTCAVKLKELFQNFAKH